MGLLLGSGMYSPWVVSCMSCICTSGPLIQYEISLPVMNVTYLVLNGVLCTTNAITCMQSHDLSVSKIQQIGLNPAKKLSNWQK